jgi:hypothetical protein
MMTAVAYLGLIVMLQAWPVYSVLDARYRGLALNSGQLIGLVVGLGLALLISIAAIVIPLRIAVQRIEDLDR